MVKVIEEVLRSKLLQREIQYKVILPETYEEHHFEYPVIYLLHGLFGCADNWLQLTQIRQYIKKKDIVVVLPEGYNSWYSDSATIKTDKFESYLLNELIPTIEETYTVSKCRKKRAIAGLSMGGFGALKFALKRSDLFIFAASMSGAFNATKLSKKNKHIDWNDLQQSVSEVFGNELDSSRIENDLFTLIERLSESEISMLPCLYIDCGIDDSFININRSFSEKLREKSIQHSYFEISGGHNWEYWNQQLKQILSAAEAEFYRQ